MSSPSSRPPNGQGDEEADEEELVEGEVVEERRQRGARLDLQASRYVSPLPPADDLERYQELIPDSPERLLTAGEREQAHRHAIDERLVALDEESMPQFYAGQRRGHVFGLILGLTIGVAYLAVMALAVLEGASVAGIAGAAVGLAAMIWAARRDPSGPSPPEPGEASGDAPGPEASTGDQPSGGQ